MAMASNIISRFLPPAAGEPSIYETLKQHDDEVDDSDIEDRAGMAIDEENLGDPFRDYEIDDESAASGSVIGRPDRGGLPESAVPRPRNESTKANKRRETDDIDNEVPQSLLFEDDHNTAAEIPMPENFSRPTPVPGPSSRTTRTKWQTTQQQQRLHNDPPPPTSRYMMRPRQGRPLGLTDPRERAAWMWANVDNLDQFLNEVYDYYTGHGIWSILLSRVVKLL